MKHENKFKIGLALQGIALSMDDATLERNKERIKLIEEIVAGDDEGDVISRKEVLDHLAIIAKRQAKSYAQKSMMGRVMYFVENMDAVNMKDMISRADAIDACNQSINLLEAVDRIKEL